MKKRRWRDWRGRLLSLFGRSSGDGGQSYESIAKYATHWPIDTSRAANLRLGGEAGCTADDGAWPSGTDWSLLPDMVFDPEFAEGDFVRVGTGSKWSGFVPVVAFTDPEIIISPISGWKASDIERVQDGRIAGIGDPVGIFVDGLTGAVAAEVDVNYRAELRSNGVVFKNIESGYGALLIPPLVLDGEFTIYIVVNYELGLTNRNYHLAGMSGDPIITLHIGEIASEGSMVCIVASDSDTAQVDGPSQTELDGWFLLRIRRDEEGYIYFARSGLVEERSGAQLSGDITIAGVSCYDGFADGNGRLHTVISAGNSYPDNSPEDQALQAALIAICQSQGVTVPAIPSP